MTRGFLLIGLWVAACGETTVATPPVVVACHDVDMVVQDTVFLGASAQDSDGAVARFEWWLVQAPDVSNASVTAAGEKGELGELRTGGLPGGYVVGVTATDSQGLTSEPDYVTVILRPQPGTVQVAVACTEGCRAEGLGIAADEATSLALRAEVSGGGFVSSYRWSAIIERDPEDTLGEFFSELTVEADGANAQVTLPAVARNARIAVSVTAEVTGAPEASGRLELVEMNSVDEPPEIAIEWRQPGASDPAEPGTKVLPGDAILVTAKVSDPNMDPVTCRFTAWGVPVYRREATDSCKVTLYPLGGGTLELAAVAVTDSPEAEMAATPVQIAVNGFSVRDGSVPLSAIAVDGQGRAVAAAATGEQFYLFEGEAKETFQSSCGASCGGGAAVAVSEGRDPQLALVGYGASPIWSRLDLSSGSRGADIGWEGAANPPERTFAMAAGSLGRVFAATNSGLARFEPESGVMTHWQPSGGLAPQALALGPNPNSETGEKLVWYSEGDSVYYLAGEDVGLWGTERGALVGAVEKPKITALCAGTSKLYDLWIGTGPTGGESGYNGLFLFRNSVETGIPRMDDGEELFGTESGIVAVAVEQEGPYEGDAWVVGGRGVHRVSRAPDVEGNIAAVPLDLDGEWESWIPRAIAVSAQGGRRVVAATGAGLVSTP